MKKRRAKTAKTTTKKTKRAYRKKAKVIEVEVNAADATLHVVNLPPGYKVWQPLSGGTWTAQFEHSHTTDGGHTLIEYSHDGPTYTEAVSGLNAALGQAFKGLPRG